MNSKMIDFNLESHILKNKRMEKDISWKQCNGHINIKLDSQQEI